MEGKWYKEREEIHPHTEDRGLEQGPPSRHSEETSHADNFSYSSLWLSLHFPPPGPCSCSFLAYAGSSHICMYAARTSRQTLPRCHHPQTSAQIPLGWKQFPPPLNILSCLCFSCSNSPFYLLFAMLSVYVSFHLQDANFWRATERSSSVLVLCQTQDLHKNICLMKPHNPQSSKNQ